MKGFKNIIKMVAMVTMHGNMTSLMDPLIVILTQIGCWNYDKGILDDHKKYFSGLFGLKYHWNVVENVSKYVIMI